MIGNKSKGFFLYRFYYGDCIVYLGRTKQKINDRLRGHFFNKAMHKNINIHKVTRIEVATLKTLADMYVYEIYYINLIKPIINSDDKACDQLNVELPELKWFEYEPHLMDHWKRQIPIKEKFVECWICKGKGRIYQNSKRGMKCHACEGRGQTKEYIYA